MKIRASTNRAVLFSGMAVLALAALSVSGCAESAGPRPTSDFHLPTLEGSIVGPPDFLGQVVVVDFWASWCIPCRKQTAILEPLHAEYDGRSVQFLAVDLGEDEATVREFVARAPFSYPVLLDPEDRLTYEMGIYGLPTVMVVDRSGEVAYFETGISTAEVLRAVLSETLG